ncbi:uncharacterized membrane protein YidH (DUF202 family) [Roseococcus suduntuyensis]|uniref:Uncharacterized membrane protein YidH (DUF202 family) n=2 Tax=Roseococcus suduntuyensis TaxID=455361 RepID=A0A840AAS0_9PROT|nr:uncharacterized membrane protein YidH (DUF202 family) [Roseococcus suduntuyensis]
MDMGIVLRIGAGAVVALLGLVLATRTTIELRVTQEQLGVVLILGGVFFAYRAVKAWFDAADHDRHGD